MAKRREPADEPWLLDDVEEVAALDDEHEAPAFATVRVVEVQKSQGSQDTAWHPELAPGMKCPQCRKHDLKRHRSTVYCATCKQRWWCQRPV